MKYNNTLFNAVLLIRPLGIFFYILYNCLFFTMSVRAIEYNVSFPFRQSC